MNTLRVDDTMDDRSSPLMDRLTTCWQWLGRLFERRPLAVILVVVGALAFAGFMGAILVKQDRQQTRLNDVQRAFCNGDAPYNKTQQENCRKLLDQLLENPTAEQAAKLRKIVKEAP